MDLSAKRAAVDAQSVKLYLRRQEVQLQLQQLQAIAAQIDRELLCLDGETRALEGLQREATPEGNATPSAPVLVKPKVEGAA